MARRRAILHVDMDAFYASVEQRDNAELRGKPVVVGGTGPRGVVAAASYEVRAFGVHSAMPMRQALTRCPDAVCVRPRMDHYQVVSRAIFDVFRRYTPVVEGLSLDEAFLDVTDGLRLFGGIEAIGRGIKRAIRDETQLTASVGIGPNKLVAKIASDLEKPDGFVHVTPDRVRPTLDPLPVSSIGGIGPRTAKRLNALGLYTLHDLRTAPEGRLRPVFGRYTARMQQRAAGIDERPVGIDMGDKSISAEETYDTDLADATRMNTKLLRLTDKVAARLRDKGLAAGVVAVKIRRADFTTYTRQQHVSPPTCDTRVIYAVAQRQLARWLAEHPGAQVRLLGIGASALSPGRQLGLFEDTSVPGELDATVDRIRDRFGTDALRRGSTLEAEPDVSNEAAPKPD